MSKDDLLLRDDGVAFQGDGFGHWRGAIGSDANPSPTGLFGMPQEARNTDGSGFRFIVDTHGCATGLHVWGRACVSIEQGADNLDSAWGHPRRQLVLDSVYARAFVAKAQRELHNLGE